MNAHLLVNINTSVYNTNATNYKKNQPKDISMAVYVTFLDVQTLYWHIA